MHAFWKVVAVTAAVLVLVGWGLLAALRYESSLAAAVAHEEVSLASTSTEVSVDEDDHAKRSSIVPRRPRSPISSDHVFFIRPKDYERQSLGGLFQRCRRKMIYALAQGNRLLLLPDDPKTLWGRGNSPTALFNNGLDPAEFCNASSRAIDSNFPSYETEQVCRLCEEIRKRFTLPGVVGLVEDLEDEQPRPSCTAIEGPVAPDDSYFDCLHFYLRYQFTHNIFAEFYKTHPIERKPGDIAVHYRVGDTRDDIKARIADLKLVHDVIRKFIDCGFKLNVFMFVEDREREYLEKALDFPYEVVDSGNDDMLELYQVASFDTIIQGHSGYGVLASFIQPGRRIITDFEGNKAKYTQNCFQIAEVFDANRDVVNGKCDALKKAFLSPLKMPPWEYI